MNGYGCNPGGMAPCYGPYCPCCGAYRGHNSNQWYQQGNLGQGYQNQLQNQQLGGVGGGLGLHPAGLNSPGPFDVNEAAYQG